MVTCIKVPINCFPCYEGRSKSTHQNVCTIRRYSNTSRTPESFIRTTFSCQPISIFAQVTRLNTPNKVTVSIFLFLIIEPWALFSVLNWGLVEPKRPCFSQKTEFTRYSSNIMPKHPAGAHSSTNKLSVKAFPSSEASLISVLPISLLTIRFFLRWKNQQSLFKLSTNSVLFMEAFWTKMSASHRSSQRFTTQKL